MSEARRCPSCAETIETAVEACPWCGDRQKVPGTDEEQLRLLSIFHTVLGALTAVFSCFPLVHVGVGLATLRSSSPDGPPAWFGWLFVAAGGLAVAFGWTFAVLLLVSARNLARRRRRGLCTLTGALSCLMVPLGTILGVFTLIVLARPSVRDRFDRPS